MKKGAYFLTACEARQETRRDCQLVGDALEDCYPFLRLRCLVGYQEEANPKMEGILMHRLLVMALLGWCAIALAWAQETPKQPEPKPEALKPADPLPTVDEILDKYVEASGGKSALEKITSRHSTGSFELPAMGATGTWEGFAKAPNKNALIIDVPGFGVIRQGFDGTAGWDDNPMAGLRDLSATELTAKKFDSDFHKAIRFRELYSTMTVKGKEKVGDREAYMMEAKPESLPVEKLYFDTENFLLVRLDVEREGPQGVALVQTVFEDYKQIDGVKIPYTLKITNPAFSMLIKFTEVKHNVPIEDSNFTKPAPSKTEKP